MSSAKAGLGLGRPRAKWSNGRLAHGWSTPSVTAPCRSRCSAATRSSHGPRRRVAARRVCRGHDASPAARDARPALSHSGYAGKGIRDERRPPALMPGSLGIRGLRPGGGTLMIETDVRALVLGGDLTVGRLGYGAMQLTGRGVW